MRKVAVEICLGGEDAAAVRRAAMAAAEGGAARVELCRDLHQDGLTPPVSHIAAAREGLGGRCELLVMVRPRDGDFVYTPEEVGVMAAQIRAAAEAGADGVVFGALRPENGRVCEDTVRRLLGVAGECGLAVTFHRAFDATPDPGKALETLIDCGVRRVLTSGCPWGGGGTALDGVAGLRRTIAQAAGRLEVVIGGGVTAALVPRLFAGLGPGDGPLSVHAFSGAQVAGVTDAGAVRALVAAARKAGASWGVETGGKRETRP